jgi:hypothetical protein
VKDKVALGALNQAAFRAYFNPGSDHLQSLAKTLGGADKSLVANYSKALSRLGRGQFLYHSAEGHPIVAHVKP